MLKYFKRQRSRYSRDDTNSIDNIAGSDVPDSAKRDSLRSSSSFCDEVIFEDEAVIALDAEGCGMSIAGASAPAVTDESINIFTYQSRLSMSLSAIVADQNCLSFFVQYLETRNALPLIKFYLDTENFKTAALTQLDIEQKLLEDQFPLMEDHDQHVSSPVAVESTAKCNEQPRSDLEENNSVPELKTLCDLSMRKPLTDDEKSQIYAETNEKITKCHATSRIKSNSQISLCSEPELDWQTKNDAISKASIKDAIAIYQKYLNGNSLQFVSLPVALLSQISLLVCRQKEYVAGVENVGNELIPISVNCFDDAQNYVLAQLERNYLQDFLQSTFYCKYCIELIENDAHLGYGSKLTIFDILYSEVTLFFFMEFLEQQHERDCLDFWTTAINFRKSYLCDSDSTKINNDNEAQADAMIIYEKYFSLQSECRLWMSDKLRCRVEESICAVGTAISHCFDLPLYVTAKYLEKKYLYNFLSCQLFENYLNELKLKVNEDISTASLSSNVTLQRDNSGKISKLSRHRKTMSDCTNGSSSQALLKHISQHNTLLAMESPHNHLQLQLKTSNFNIDTRQITNPKMLWTRSSCTEGGLQFGRVNSLGRYERDFDAVDACQSNVNKSSNWSLTMGGNKFKNAMRKLVNLPEEKMQEEIAWQVAEMIVKDVTSVTLHDSK